MLEDRKQKDGVGSEVYQLDPAQGKDAGEEDALWEVNPTDGLRLCADKEAPRWNGNRLILPG